MAIQTFKRYECKYLLSKQVYHKLLTALPPYMEADAFCQNHKQYSIFNIYFDTPDYQIIRHCLEKPYYKEKLRMRSYATPQTPQDLVFLELKKKIGGIVSKRRAQMSYGQALAFAVGGAMPILSTYADQQVCAEIADFLHRYPLQPMTAIAYTRSAFFGKLDKDLRISFDHDICSRQTQLDLSGGGDPVLPKDMVLMEVKCLGALPLWLCHVFHLLGIRRTGFSKYGTAYKNYVNHVHVA